MTNTGCYTAQKTGGREHDGLCGGACGVHAEYRKTAFDLAQQNIVNAAILAERERCAKIAEVHECEETSRCVCPQEISARIRGGE